MSAFATTQWSLVRRAAGETAEARAALDALCRRYRAPVCAYLARSRVPGHDTEDLVQGFFADMVESGLAARADATRGSFRAFLLASLAQFVARTARHAAASKRNGGGAIDLGEIEGLPDPSADPEAAFHQAWSDTVLVRALAHLREEAEAAGKSALYARLSEYLLDPPEHDAFVRLGEELGMRPNTLAVAVHRLRDRFRKLVRREIAQTLDDPDRLDEELSHLG